MGDWSNWQKNDWSDKKDTSSGWNKDAKGDDWSKKPNSTWAADTSWDKKDWKQESWGKKEDTWNTEKTESKEKNDWGNASWTPPDDGALACLKTKKEWTKDAWEAAEQKKVEDKDKFYLYQKTNADGQITSQKSGWELDQEEDRIFGQRSGANAGIDFDKYEHIPAEVKGNRTEELMTAKSFEELFLQFPFLPQELMNNIRRIQYKTPTPVQRFAIPVALAGRDVMCCAQTGSGKTASFLIPIVGRMMLNHTNPIGSMSVPFEGECDPDTLILAPTRELCVQIYEEACKFTHRTPYRVVRIYGGEKAGEQMQEISKGTDVLVATTGRLLDFIDRKLIRLDRVRHLVIDEADRMLDMGFEPQVRQLVKDYRMPAFDRRQTMMFSATFSSEVQALAQEFLYDHVWVGIGRVGGAVDTVTQEFVEVTQEEKVDKLMDLIDHFLDTRSPGEVGIIFCNSKNSAKFLDEYLWEKKIDSASIHGDLKQSEREEAIRKIRNSEVDVLVATDVASRGLDIEKVRLVINYDLPQEVDAYIHRIGRTGRIGNRGKAISFVARDPTTNFPLENLTVLKELVNILGYTHNDVPAWLQPLIDRSEVNPTKGWGGRDARDGNYGSYEEREKTAWKPEAPAGNSNDWWSTKTGDAWKKADADAVETPAAEEPAADTAAEPTWNNTWNESAQNTRHENGAEQKGQDVAPKETTEWSGSGWSGGWSSNWK